jgi:two-component system sensor histidine kinase AlgZ
MLRLLLGANLLALLAALLQSQAMRDWLPRYVEIAGLVEPLLLLMLGLLAGLRDLLRRLPLRLAQGLILLLLGAASLMQNELWLNLGLLDNHSVWRTLSLAIAAGSTLLAYFELRAHAFSPAQAEARLVALNARIRPHFLFNSLNAALSLIRARPQQAEEALESLADLFRAAMRDPAELIKLSDEIALSRQYLELEKLRLGERLTIDWQIDAMPTDALIPPLMLQPLLENAVYHGIEPLADGGTICIKISQQENELSISIANPSSEQRGEQSSHAKGNQLALANIRERLALYYDLEARLDIESRPQDYQVRILLPCQAARP